MDEPVELSNIEQRLKRHVNLGDESDPQQFLSYCTLEQNWDPENLEKAVMSFIGILTDLNHHINGPIPSKSVAGPDGVSRQVIGAVLDVCNLLKVAAHKALQGGDNVNYDSLKNGLWRIELCWYAVIAGDIDDLETHIQEEEPFR